MRKLQEYIVYLIAKKWRKLRLDFKNQLSKEIQEELNETIGDFTKPIITSGGLILKINDVKTENVKIDKEHN